MRTHVEKTNKRQAIPKYQTLDWGYSFAAHHHQLWITNTKYQIPNITNTTNIPLISPNTTNTQYQKFGTGPLKSGKHSIFFP